MTKQLSTRAPNVLFVQGAVERLIAFSPTSNANVTRLRDDRIDISFDPPYQCQPGETYALRRVKKQWQIWEVVARPTPTDPGRMVWVREAPRVTT